MQEGNSRRKRTDRGNLRVDCTLSPRMTVRSRSQDDSSTPQFSTGMRYERSTEAYQPRAICSARP